jgi:hypothetical protein
MLQIEENNKQKFELMKSASAQSGTNEDVKNDIQTIKQLLLTRQTSSVIVEKDKDEAAGDETESLGKKERDFPFLNLILSISSVELQHEFDEQFQFDQQLRIGVEAMGTAEKTESGRKLQLERSHHPLVHCYGNSCDSDSQQQQQQQ